VVSKSRQRCGQQKVDNAVVSKKADNAVVSKFQITLWSAQGTQPYWPQQAGST